MNVYDAFSTPGMNERQGKESTARAKARVDAGTHRYVTLPSGHTAIQALHTQEFMSDRRNNSEGGGYLDNWRPKLSGGVKVWQLMTPRTLA